jgi:hypothetical protein
MRRNIEYRKIHTHYAQISHSILVSSNRKVDHDIKYVNELSSLDHYSFLGMLVEKELKRYKVKPQLVNKELKEGDFGIMLDAIFKGKGYMVALTFYLMRLE